MNPKNNILTPEALLTIADAVEISLSHTVASAVTM
jgi:hypothetical protein